jgi:hypothetical protein
MKAITIGKQNDKYFAQYFESLTQFSQWISVTNKTTDSDSSESNGYDFTHSDSFQDADAYMKGLKKWEEVYDKIEKLNIDIDQVQGDGYVMKRKPSVAGGSVHMGRYLRGTPECMIRNIRTEAERRGKIVDIYYDPCISGGYSTDAMITYGLAVFMSIDALEQEGYRVNLFLSATNNSKDGYQVVFIKVKDSSELLEMNSMLYAIAHPSMFRRHIFAYLERSWYWQYGYGKVPDACNYKRHELMLNYKDNPSKSFFLRNLQNLQKNESKMNSKELAQYFFDGIKQQMSDYDNGISEPLKGESNFSYMW